MAENEQQAAAQLEIESQINKVIKDRTAILKNQSKFLSSQVQLAMEMCNALDCEGLDGMKERLSDIKDGLSEASEEAQRLEGGAQSAGAAINKMADEGTKKGGAMSKVFSPMGGMFAGLGVGMMSAFKGATNMIGGFITSATRITGIIGNIGKALITLPFSLLNNLTSLAAGAGGGVSALRQAMEEMRDTFGSLAKNEGKQVMTGFKTMKTQMRSMSKHGIHFSKVFGPGSEGMANALKAVGEQMTDLGSNMNKFGDEVSKNAGVFQVYRQGLGLTGDAFKAMGTLASTNGKSLTETMDQVGSQAINMGKQFGIGPKQLATSMAEMAGDVANFGTLSVKQLSSLAVYTKKLGIEAKELNGVIDSWDNFEDAATGASKLSQAFGMNIDAMEMMKEQDPGKRMDMLRESFQATGKSVEDLSRQELKLLAAQMGLSEEAAKKALSSDMDYDDILEGSEEAEAKTISQAEAMKELADSLKQVFGGGGQGPKTFSEALAKGFKKGIMHGKGMRKMFSNIRKSMRQVYLFGKDLGKMFVNMFPGIQGMIKGLTDLFSPARFKKLRKDLLGAFKQLFIDLRHDPKGGVETFSKKIKEIFGNFFDSTKGPGKAFMDGLKTFGKTVLLLILSLAPVLMKGLASLIKKLADFIRDPSALTDGAQGLGDGLNTALAEAWKNIEATWPILRDAFYDLWDAIKPSLGKLWNKIWPYLLSAVILKSIVAVAANMTIGAVFGTLFKAMKGLFSSALSKGAAAGGKGAEKKMKKKGGIIDTLRGVVGKLADMKKSKIVQAGINVLLLTAFLGVSVVEFAYALKYATDAVKDVDPLKLGIMAALLVGTMLAMPGIAKAAEGLKKIKLTQVASAMIKVGVVVLAMAGLTYIMGGILANMPEITTEDAKNFFMVMGAILVAGLVATLLAIPVGMLADKFGVQIAIGLGVLGVVMIALGAVGLIIGGMLSLIPNPEGVAAMMNAISGMMITTALMLPVAGMLGAMLMAFPFGTAGVAIIVAGFGVLGSLAMAMVGSLIPAMEKIASIRVGDPQSFKMITEAILAVIRAIEGFVNAVARVMEALRPGLADLAAGKSMEDNINAATGFVDAVLKNGIMPLINTIIDVAKSTDINESGLAAVKAIGEILKAVGTILQSMMPDPDMIKAIADMDTWYASGRAEAMMEKVTEYMKTAQDGAMALLKSVKETFFNKEFLKQFNGVDPNAAKVIAAFGPILEGIAGALDALKPSDAQMKAVESASKWASGSNPAAVMQKMTEYMKATEQPIKSLIETVGTQMVSIMDKIKPIIETVGQLKVDPKAMQAVTDLVVGVMGAMGNMMSGVGPAVEGATKIADKFSNASAVMRYQLENIGNLISTMGTSFTKMMPDITKIIKEMVQVAEGISDPDRMVKQVESIVKVFDVLQTITEMFAGKDATLNAYGTASESFSDTAIGSLKHNLTQFNESILKPGGPLEGFIAKMIGIKIPDGGEKKAEQLGNTFKALGIILEGLQKFKEMAPAGTGANSNDTAALNEINQAITKMQKMDFDGINKLMQKVKGIDYVSPKLMENRGKMAEHFRDFVSSLMGAGGIKPGDTFFTEQATMIDKFSLLFKGADGKSKGPILKMTLVSDANMKWRIRVADQTAELMYATNRVARIAAQTAFGNHKLAMTNFSEYAVHATTKFKDIEKVWTTRTSKGVEKMVNEIVETHDLLSKTPVVDLDAAINRFGKDMAIKTDTVSIQNKPINIHVNFNLTMDANDIAVGLSNKSRPNGKNTVKLSRYNNKSLD